MEVSCKLEKCFLFTSTSGQVLPSSYTHSTGSSIEFDAVFSEVVSDSDSGTSVKRVDVRKPEKTPFHKDKKISEQAFINEKNLISA